MPFFREFRLNQKQYVGDQFRQVYRLLLQAEFAALYAGHIQHLINEGKQMIRSNRYLLQAVLHLRRIIQICLGNGRHAYDSIHRRTDIVGHG